MVEQERQVVWTRAALECVDEIIATITGSSASAAERVFDELDATAASLSTFALRGRTVPEVEDPAIREVFVFRYRMMYRVSSDQVQILAIVHGAMDYRAHLKG